MYCMYYNTTKEMYEASFKVPKMIKTVVVNLVSKSPSITDKLAISGFCIEGKCLIHMHKLMYDLASLVY